MLRLTLLLAAVLFGAVQGNGTGAPPSSSGSTPTPTMTPAATATATVMPTGGGGDAGSHGSTTEAPHTTEEGVAVYSVKGSNGQPCIQMWLNATLSIQYLESKENETRRAEVGVPSAAPSVGGFCHEHASQLSVAWPNFELRWNFATDTLKSQWNVDSIELDYKKTEPPFQNAVIEGGGAVRLRAPSVRAPLGRAFDCGAGAVLLELASSNGSDTVALHVRRLRVQAFVSSGAFGPGVCTSVASTAAPSASPTSTSATSGGVHRDRDLSTRAAAPASTAASYTAPAIAPYVYKKVQSNMVKGTFYSPKKLLPGMNGDQSDPMSAMLWSWYTSGFYTGYYQAMQQMKKSH